jgi:membrane protein DedA with SNARE-associated domain
MITLNFLRHFVEHYAEIAYILIFLGVIIEGEIMVIIAGIFCHLGSLSVPTSFLIIFMGGISKSFIGYNLGSWLANSYPQSNFLSRVERKISYFLPRFSERPFWSIFVSRFFILGLNWVTLIFSGYKKVAREIYYKAEFLSLCVWSVGVLAIGYFFSFAALSISRDIRKFLVIILICFILFFLLEKLTAFVLELVGLEYQDKEEEKSK